MKTRHWIGLSGAALLTVATMGGCNQHRDNAAVTADIRHEMQRQQVPDTITVVVADGVANLSGTARDEQTRDKAENVAEGVNGVKRVVNTIRIITAAGDAPVRQPMAPGYQAPAPAMPRNNAENAPSLPGSENVPPAGAPR